MSVFTTTGRAAATTFVTDYQSIGINAANLGWASTYEGKTLAFGALEGSYSLHSEALLRQDLRREFFNSRKDLTWAERKEAARAFADAGLQLNADVMLAGVAYQNESIGGIGLQIRDRAQWSSKFGPFASELVFEGYGADYFDLLVLASGDTINNVAGLPDDSLALVVAGLANDPQLLGRLFDGTHVNFNWYREYALGYGRMIVASEGFELFAGIGVKHLVGLGIIQIATEGERFSAFSSLSDDFDIDYGNGVQRRRNAGLPRAAGRGWGFDMGLSALINDRIKLGVAINNIGSIKWTGNSYEASNGSLGTLATNGIDNYNFFGNIEEFVTNSGLFEWQPGAERNIALPTDLRAGAGLIVNEKVEVGADLVLPLNDVPGNFRSPLFGVGGHVNALPWLRLATGISVGGGYPVKVPIGGTLILGKGTYEAGLASRDVITFFTSRNPTISLAVGLLRFRF